MRAACISNAFENFLKMKNPILRVLLISNVAQTFIENDPTDCRRLIKKYWTTNPINGQTTMPFSYMSTQAIESKEYICDDWHCSDEIII